MIRNNIFGKAYDDAHPCFLEVGNGLVYDRIAGQYYTEESLANLAAELSYTITPYEKGDDYFYAKALLGLPLDAPAAISVLANAGSGTLTFSGGYLAAAYDLLVTYDFNGGGDQTIEIELGIGATPKGVAKALASVAWVAGTASADGNVLTVSADDDTIEKLEATITLA